MSKANSIFLYIIAVAVIGCYLLWYFDPKGRFDPIVTGRDTTIINLPPISIDLPRHHNHQQLFISPFQKDVDSIAVDS
jgi:hypothetical protein